MTGHRQTETVVIWVRRIAFALFLVAVGWVLFVGLGGRDSPDQRVMMNTMHCRNSLGVNLVSKAEAYCDDALRVVSLSSVRGMYAAEAYGQSAVLRVVQGRLAEASTLCQRAIPFWQEIDSGPNLAQALNGIAKCNGLIADVRRLDKK